MCYDNRELNINANLSFIVISKITIKPQYETTRINSYKFQQLDTDFDGMFIPR